MTLITGSPDGEAVGDNCRENCETQATPQTVTVYVRADNDSVIED